MDAVLTSLALSVGINVHLIAGKQIFTNQLGSQIILHYLNALLVDLERR